MQCRKVIAALAIIFVSGWGPAWAEEADKKTKRLEEVVVTGTRTEHTLKDVPVETVVVTREDIERTNAKTVTDALKSIPGLSASGNDNIFGTASSRARLRGLSFNDGYGLVLIDGQRIHGSGQSGAHGEYAVGLNQIPISMIERIEVVKGSGSVLYGSDAVAGVINIITRKVPKKPTGGAGAAYGWYQVKEQTRDGETTKPNDDGQHRNLSEHYAYFGDQPFERMGYLINYAHESGDSTGNEPVASKRDSVMGKVDVKLSDPLEFWIKGEASAYARGGDSTSEEDSSRLSAGMRYQPGDKYTLQLKGYLYADDFDAESSSSHRHGQIGYDQLEVQYSHKIGTNQLITAGVEFQRQGIDYLIDNSNAARTTVKEDVDTTSLYLQDELSLFNDLTLVPGLRYDDHSTFGDSFNPKLSLMYRLLKDTTLRASVGKAFKSPTIRQLYYDVPFYHSPFYIQSNPNLDPETAIGYSAGVEQWLNDGAVILSATLFRNDITDMVVSENADELYNGAELRIYRNVEEAMTQGLETAAYMLLGDGFLLTAAYTYTDSENKESGNDLTYTPKHEFSLSPDYEIVPIGVGTSATLTYVSKQYSDSDNEYTIDAHFVADAKIYKILGNQAQLSLQIDNLFNSDKGDERYYRAGRTFTIKMDFDF